MKKIIFATTNNNKIKELKQILSNKFNIVSMVEENINIEIIEDGKTFEENALKKAKEISKLSNNIVIADDSGLEIEFLNNAPGIYSSRYLGEKTPAEVKNKKILELMKNVKKENRNARFVCSIAVALPNGQVFTEQGILNGKIAFEPKSIFGFGYDPIFYLEEKNKTLGELTLEEKNKIRHRAKALLKIKPILETVLRC